MATRPLNPAQCGDLAQQFHDLAVAIGNYRLQHVNDPDMTDARQFQLQNEQMLCLQFSNHFIAQGLALEQSAIDETLQDIKRATSDAQNAIATIASVDKALQITSALAVLGASIASMNPSAIESGVEGVFSALAGSRGGIGADGAAAPAGSSG